MTVIDGATESCGGKDIDFREMKERMSDEIPKQGGSGGLDV